MAIESEYAKNIDQPKIPPKTFNKPAYVGETRSKQLSEISFEDYMGGKHKLDQKQTEKNHFDVLQEFTINGKKFRFGIMPDIDNGVAQGQKYVVLDQRGHNIFSSNESTQKYPLDGFYIGNLSKESPGPEIIVWSRQTTGLKSSNIEGRYYKYNPNANRYEIYWKDVTDKAYSLNQKNEIIKALTGTPSKFKKAFEIVQKYNPNISIIDGYKPDNRGEEYIFPSKDKNPNNSVCIYFDPDGKIYVMPGSEPPGRIDIEKYLYKDR